MIEQKIPDNFLCLKLSIRFAVQSYKSCFFVIYELKQNADV
jgi:hypothetical protein